MDNAFPNAKETGETFVHQLAGLNAGGVLAFRSTPLNVSADDTLVRVVSSAANALVTLDAHAANLQPQNLDPMALRQALAVDHARVQVAMAKAAAAITAADKALDTATKALDEPPAINNVADVLLDVELRAWFASCDQNETLTRMSKGEFPEMLAAVARGLTPGGDVARDVYRGLQRAANPAKVADLNARDETIDWAESVIGSIAAILNGAVNVVGPSVLVETPSRLAA